MAILDSITFLERYPMFEELDELIIEEEIDLAKLQFPSDKWPVEQTRNKALGLLTAHNLCLEYKDQLNLGSYLRLIEVGKELPELEDLSEKEYYSLTIYGKRLQDLISRQFGIAMFVP